MAVKRFRSRLKAKSLPKRALPKLEDLRTIAAYVGQRLTYTGDPILGGLDDYYNHPEYLQYCIENNLKPPVDCDDYSVLAYALAVNIPNAKPQMVVLVVDGLGKILSMALEAFSKLKVPYFPFHEGCLVELDDKLWFIDTNGLWELKDAQDLANRYGTAWGIKFKVVPTEYPF